MLHFMMPENDGFQPEWWARLRLLMIAVGIAGDAEFSCGNARYFE